MGSQLAVQSSTVCIRAANRPLLVYPKPMGSRPRAVTVAAAKQGVQQPAKQQARRTAQAVEQTGLWQRLTQANSGLNEAGVSWRAVLGSLALVGTTFGWLFQAVHNNGYLPTYDVLGFHVDTPLGPMEQSGIIPLVLAPIWLLYGYLQPLLDEAFRDDPATERAIQRAESLPYNALCWGSLAAMFLLSSWLYLENVPHGQIALALAPLAWANWRAFDNTKQGLVLGLLLAVGAPAAESFIANFLHLWHYDRPQIGGVVAWAGWCYWSYAHGVGNAARLAVAKSRQDK